MYNYKKILLPSILFLFISQILIDQIFFRREAKSQYLILGEQFSCVRSNQDYRWRLYSIAYPESIFLKNFYNEESFCNSVAITLSEYYPQGYDYLVICEEGFFYKNYFISMSAIGPTNNLQNCPSDDHEIARLPDANDIEITFRNFFQPEHQSGGDYVETFMDFESSDNGKWPGMRINEWLNAAREF